MTIVVLTSQINLINELKKSNNFIHIKFVKNYDDLFNIKEKEIVFLHHLDCDKEVENTFKIIDENYDCKFIALRNSPNNIEGCSLLKKGYKAYVHSLSSIYILENVISTVLANNVWIYPELMQFLINSVSVKQENNKNQLKDLTIKELEVLELVSQGLSNNKIANTLDIAEVTVKKHIGSLFKKLDVKDRLALALIFKEQN